MLFSLWTHACAFLNQSTIKNHVSPLITATRTADHNSQDQHLKTRNTRDAAHTDSCKDAIEHCGIGARCGALCCTTLLNLCIYADEEFRDDCLGAAAYFPLGLAGGFSLAEAEASSFVRFVVLAPGRFPFLLLSRLVPPPVA